MKFVIGKILSQQFIGGLHLQTFSKIFRAIYQVNFPQILRKVHLGFPLGNVMILFRVSFGAPRNTIWKPVIWFYSRHWGMKWYEERRCETKTDEEKRCKTKRQTLRDNEKICDTTRDVLKRREKSRDDGRQRETEKDDVRWRDDLERKEKAWDERRRCEMKVTIRNVERRWEANWDANKMKLYETKEG